jgi:uncharacterized protein involved in exopolysaccharide biosynthesis
MPEELRLMPRPTRTPSPTMRDMFGVIFRHQRLMAISFCVIFATALLWGWLCPSYQSEMKLLVRRSRLDPVMTATPSQSQQFEHDEITEEELNSEAELLSSEDVLNKVVQDSGLADDTWFSEIRGDNQQQRIARAARRLAKKLEIEPVRKATMIGVSYSSNDPAKSARVLRSLSNVYLERHLRVRRPSGEFNFFDQQVAEAGRNLEESESKLMSFAEQRGVVSGSLERDLALQKLSEADSMNKQTQVSIAEAMQRARMLNTKLALLPEHATTQVKSSDNPDLLGKIKSRLLELNLKRTELLTKFDPSYRLVKEVETEIEQANAAIAAQDAAPLLEKTIEPDPDRRWAQTELVKSDVELSGLRARYRATAELVRDFRSSAIQLNTRALEQQALLRDTKTAEERYLLYSSKREEARIGDALDAGGILNVVLAEQPTTPALPASSEFNFGMIGLVLAGATSTGLAFAADYLDPGFRTPDDVLAYLGTPVLASLPGKTSDTFGREQ